MALFLGILLFAFFLTAILIVPYINVLYRLHLTQHIATSGLVKSEFIHKLHRWKEGTPVGGGLLLIFLISVLYVFIYPLSSRAGVYITTVFPIKEELNVIFFTFISFGLVGLYDDFAKIFHLNLRGTTTIPTRAKYILKLILASISALLLYQNLKIDFINVPYVGVLHLGWGYIPLATFIIWFFASAIDVSDGLDGLASGLLFICLLAFWAISLVALDTPLSVFLALWIGSLLAFLYFNVFPARIWLGNAGSISFGATLAVVALLLGKPVALVVIASLFVLEFITHSLQQIWLVLFKKPLFPISPAHHWLQVMGWPEPKIVLRLWVLALLLAVFGLWLAGT